MEDQLSETQKALIKAAISLLQNAQILLRQVDEEIQSLGSTGENLVNHTEYDLKMTCEYMQSWLDNGVDL